MEKFVKIKTKDGHIIYGTLNAAEKKSDKLIIFVHGFTGHQNEHIFFNGARYFTDKGFDTIRFDFYAGEKGARNFRDTKISQHGKDITTVVKHFRKKYKKIYVVGHSYGGTSLLFVNQDLVEGFVFWDASYIEWSEESNGMKYDEHLDAYILNEGIEHIVGKGFVEELKNFPDCGELISKINKPVFFVTAGRKGNSKAGKIFYSKANQPKTLINIMTADHCFNNLKDEDKLHKETYEWIKKLQ